jgi:crotonobetainyl-CoA:carnitine CoA-transferase CaiB-like acyl-CoA transferase
MLNSGIFEGVRIVELAQYVFVPGASVMLADLGAEVIHVEPPKIGDPYRQLAIGDGREAGGVNLAMEQNNRNKKSLCLDLKSEEGYQALLDLLKTADVFLTSLRPKALAGLKLDPETLKQVNPRLIYARGNGLGFRGPEFNKPGFDAASFWARGGMAYVMSRPGQPLTGPRPALGDHTGSMGLAFGIASALYRRAVTGEAPLVENSLLANAVWVLSSDVTYSQMQGYVVHHPENNRFPLMKTYGTRDGRHILLMLLDPRPYWRNFCKLIDIEHLADDPRFADAKARIQNGDELAGIIAEKIGARSWAQWKPQFEQFDAPWELIADMNDVANDPQVLANEMIFPITAPNGQTVNVVAGPVAFDGKSVSVIPRGSPDMGQHTDEVLASIGYTAERIADLKARDIAG